MTSGCFFFFHPVPTTPGPRPRITVVRDSTDPSLLDACVPMYGNPTWPAEERPGIDVLIAVLCVKLQTAGADVEMVS